MLETGNIGFHTYKVRLNTHLPMINTTLNISSLCYNMVDERLIKSPYTFINECYHKNIDLCRSMVENNIFLETYLTTKTDKLIYKA